MEGPESPPRDFCDPIGDPGPAVAETIGTSVACLQDPESELEKSWQEGPYQILPAAASPWLRLLVVAAAQLRMVGMGGG